MNGKFIQRLEESNVTHENCEFIIFDIKELTEDEVLCQCKVKNQSGEFVGLIPFHFNRVEGKTVEEQANIELENIVGKLNV